MINSTQPAVAQNYAALPDATDRASSLVGYNINNYVFGNNLNQPNGVQGQAPNVSGPSSSSGKKSGILGVLALGLLGAGAFLGIKAGKGGNIKLPNFGAVKNSVTGFFAKFKKP